MAKKERIAEIHFYEWRTGAWATSETRDRLNATGRGIYRELIDQCNVQGKFPDDSEWICRKCACTMEEFNLTWPIIKKHFPVSRKSGYRFSPSADIERRRYFSFINEQRRKRKVGVDKASRNKELDDRGQTVVEEIRNRGSTKKELHQQELTTTGEGATATTVQQQAQAGFVVKHWPKTTRAIRADFPDATDVFVGKLVNTSLAAFLSVEGRDTQEVLTDAELADAVAHCKKKKQDSAGLYLTTVPECIRTWATPDEGAHA